MRSDSEILHDVQDELDWEPSVDATQIDVDVVRDRARRREAIDSVRAASGAATATDRLAWTPRSDDVTLAISVPRVFGPLRPDLVKRKNP